MKSLQNLCFLFVCGILWQAASLPRGLAQTTRQLKTPVLRNSRRWNGTPLTTIKTVFLIVMENHNWTGDNAGAASGNPDLKHNLLAPYINGELLQTAAHAEQYFNPPGNHPSQTNYLWLEAGSNFGVLSDTQPGQPQLFTHKHLVRLLQDAGISWKAYAEPDFGNPSYQTCPLDFSILDVNHLGPVYFNDINGGLAAHSKECTAHVKPYAQLSSDLAEHSTARYNIIVPNLCHSGHQAVSPCAPGESTNNTARSDTWLKQNVPLILRSREFKNNGALFITWDEGEDDGDFKDGPIGMFVLSPLAKGAGKTAYSNAIHYDHSSTLKTLQEIFGVYPLLGGAAKTDTVDLSDLFR